MSDIGVKITFLKVKFHEKFAFLKVFYYIYNWICNIYQYGLRRYSTIGKCVSS